MLKQIVMVATLVTLPSIANSAIYIKFPGVPGESQHVDYRDHIEAEAWSWGTASGNRSTCVGDISINKVVGKASPILLMDQVMGKTYPTATLVVTKEGGARAFEYIVLELENVKMVSHSTSHSTHGAPQEGFSLNFEKIKYTYTPQNDDGSAGTPVVAEIFGGTCK